MFTTEKLNWSAPREYPFKNLMILAAWFGLVTGLVEGVGLLAFQFGWLHWEIPHIGVCLPIIWICTLFDLLLFLAVAFVLLALARFFPKLRAAQLAVFLFTLLAFLDWLLIPRWIRHSAALVLAAGLATAFGRWFHRHKASVLQFWCRSLPWVVAVALLVLFGIQGGLWLRERMALARLPAASPDAPNILIIVVDTLRADHLSGYGYHRATSPHMDRLAQQGVPFENAFATSSWTLPSHASLLTGRFPHEHGAQLEALDGRYPTLPEVLSSRGYRTGAFSANTEFFTASQGLGRGFAHFEDLFHSIADRAARTLYGQKFDFFIMPRLGFEDIPARKRAKQVNEETLAWIDRGQGRPFFAFLNYFDSHDPYLPPQPYRSKFSKLKNPGGKVNTYRGHRESKMTPEDLQGEMDAYDGAIAYVDEHIGQLLVELEKRGLSKNTLIVLTSDHGEAFMEHGLVQHKNALYLELIRVPLIFSWPGHVPEGVRVTHPVSNAGLPATLMELIGVRDQKEFPGPSLARLWEAPTAPPEWPYPLAELAHMPFPGMQRNPNYHGGMKSLVSPRWHYLVHEKFGPALYEWQQDPSESKDWAPAPEGKSIVADFATRLQYLMGGAR